MQQPSKNNPVAGQKCIYCGSPATDVDHVPPTRVVTRWRLPLSQQTVPACDFCNRTLSDRVALMTLPARKAWITASIWRKRMPHRRREKFFYVESPAQVARQAARNRSGRGSPEADNEEVGA